MPYDIAKQVIADITKQVDGIKSEIDRITDDVTQLKIKDAGGSVKVENINSELNTLKRELDKLKDNLKFDLEKMSELVASIKIEINDTLDDYVSNDRFEPVKLIAYGALGAIGMAFIGALITLVFI